MKVTERSFAQNFVKMTDGKQQPRFHERCGERIFCRIPKVDLEAVRRHLNLNGDFVPIGT